MPDEGARVSLFQRITMPFGEPDEDASDRSAMRNAAGERLRERRQQLGLDLDAVAEVLCIKPIYLAAIEQGRTEELPGPTYAIGFIRAYAIHLGLDGERVLDSYRRKPRTPKRVRDLTLPVPLDERGVPGGRVLLTGLVLALVGYGAWYYVSTGERERPERVAEVPAELEIDRAGTAGRAPRAQAGAPAPGTATTGLASAAVPSAQPAPVAASAPPRASAPQFSSGLLTTAQPAAGAAAPDSPPSTAGPVAGATIAGAVGPAASGSSAATDAAAAGRSQPDASAAATPSGSIDIRALANSWVQIRDAGQEIVFARVLKTGETYGFDIRG